MAKPHDAPQGRLQDKCEQLTEKVKLLRDYATSPGNIWLARGELNRIGQLVAELEQLLGEIDAS